MKLNVDVNEVVLSNVGATGEFRIRNSAKAFKILSDGLYSNKVKAVIRELSCNAVDSHIAAGKEDVKFEVTLPCAFEPWFSVKDYGLGLDHEQVTNIYTTYFESTKTDSNSFIGALGLGSKSPFSYTENFTVIAVKDNMKRIYTAFINDQGVPSVALMTEEATEEPNGVEVKFSVVDPSDYQVFKHEANSVFKWFKNKPTLFNFDRDLQDVNYVQKDIVPGVHITDQHNASWAIMGNIAYPIDKNNNSLKKGLGDLIQLLESGLAIDFSIGDLDFAASREELSYVPITIESIRQKLELLRSSIESVVKEKVKDIKNDWEMALFLENLSKQSSIFKIGCASYVKNNKVPLVEVDHYGRIKPDSIFFTSKDLADMGISLTGFTVNYSESTSPYKEHNHYDKGNYIKGYTISVSDKAKFVLNDLKTGCAVRARYHYVTVHNSSPYTSVYCINYIGTDPLKRDETFEAFLKKIHNPPVVERASNLEKRPSLPREVTSGICTAVPKAKKHRYYYNSNDKIGYKWEPTTDGITDDETYVYVFLKGHTALNKDGTEVSFMDIVSMARYSGLDALKNVNFYGVRKSAKSDIEGRDNWVWYEDYIAEQLNKLSPELIKSMVISRRLDASNYRAYNNVDVLKLLPNDSRYKTLIKPALSLKSDSADLKVIDTLCKLFSKNLELEKIEKEVSDIFENLNREYPLLTHLNGLTPASLIAEYINLIEKTGEKNV